MSRLSRTGDSNETNSGWELNMEETALNLYPEKTAKKRP